MAVELLVGLVRVRGSGGVVVGEAEMRRGGKVRDKVRMRELIESMLLGM